MAQAEQGLAELRGCVDTIITIPNSKLREVEENITLVDRQTIREFVHSHSSGIDIVATPSDDESWLKFGGEGIGAIIEQLARVYEFVVVDTAGSFDPFVKACMNASTLTLLVTSSDVSSVRDAGTAVKRTAKWGQGMLLRRQ